MRFINAFLLCSAFVCSTVGSARADHPVVFTENKGQICDQDYHVRKDILFAGYTHGMAYYLKNSGISYQLYKVDAWKEESIKGKQEVKEVVKVPERTSIYRLDLQWLNTSDKVIVEHKEELPGYDNYYLGHCGKGITEVHSYQSILYHNLYKAVDLHFYNKEGALKYDFILKPGADYTNIKIAVAGAETIFINAKGELVIRTPLGDIIDEAPVVMQGNKKLDSKWTIANNVIGFEIINYNPSVTTIIDPAVRVWGTYYTGGSAEFGFTTTTDQSGNVYLGGNTGSNTTTLIATSGAHQTTYGGPSWDGFLVKFNGNGVRQWGTYYGGFGTEYIYGSATDQAGNVYVAGSTQSAGPSISTVGSHQTNNGGGVTDAFLVKFNTNGIRQWGTYYGDTGDETGYSCAIDPSGNVYLAGVTSSSVGTSIATIGSHQPSFGGNLYDGFLAKFNSAGVRLWGTYYGANQQEYAYNCCTDKSGNVYITGEAGTSSGTEIATPGSHQAVFGGSSLDGYLVKFNSNGIRQWGTYYGGTGGDRGYDCVAYGGFVYLAGVTTTSVSGVIATASTHQPNYGGGSGNNNAYLVQFDTNGVRQWGTYYGGFNTGEIAYACAVDAFGNPYLFGQTSCTASIGVIETSGAHQTSYGGSFADAFLAGFTRSSGTRISGTYYGGSGIEYAKDCATDLFGNIYFTGYTSTNTGTAIATPGSYQATSANGSNNSAWLAKFFECNGIPSAPVNTTAPSNLIVCAGKSTTLAVNGSGLINWFSSLSSTTSIGTGTSIVTSTLAAGTYSFYAEASTCTVSPRTLMQVTVNPLPLVTAMSSSVSICDLSNGCLSASGASSYVWVGPCGFNSTVQSPCFPFSMACMCNYTVTGTDANGCKNTATVCINVVPNPTVNITTSNTLICAGQSATLTSNGANTYSWSTSASGSVIAVSPTVTANYSVTGTDLNGCSNTALITQSVSACTGIQQLGIIGNEIEVYPNPTSGEFTLLLPTNTKQTRLEIYNSLGQLILSEPIASFNSVINISQLSNGLYLLKVYQNDEVVYKNQLIKR